MAANARPGMAPGSPRLPVETESGVCFWVGAAQWIPPVPGDNLGAFGLSESSDGRADSNYGLERTFAARKSLNPALGRKNFHRYFPASLPNSVETWD